MQRISSSRYTLFITPKQKTHKTYKHAVIKVLNAKVHTENANYTIESAKCFPHTVPNLANNNEC